MLVLNLSCAQGHLFEGWFGSAADFESQQQRQLLSCPVCGHQELRRLPTAARLNVSGLKADAKPPAARTQVQPGSDTPAQIEDMQRQLQQLALQAVRQVLATTEDVGERFADEARRIHYGEAEVRGIRGHASLEEAQALAEEGIAAVALPLPDAFKGSLQ